MKRGYKGAKSALTQDRLKKCLNYDPSTGVFIRLTQYRNRGVGKEAGWLCPAGSGKWRVKIAVDGHDYMAHRLAWLYMTGGWPEEEVDHINGDGTNNRWVNLREASSSENLRNRGPQRNNTSGYKGVCFVKARGFFVAGIKINGRRKHLGVFHTAEDAHKAYCEAAEKIHGAFAKVR